MSGRKTSGGRAPGPRKTRNEVPSTQSPGTRKSLAPGKPPAEFTNEQRKYLRGLGHRIKPLVLVGKEGVTPGLIARIREELVLHELIKVKILQNSPMDKGEVGPLLVEGSGAALVTTIGKTFLLYAPHPLEPVIRLPRVRVEREE